MRKEYQILDELEFNDCSIEGEQYCQWTYQGDNCNEWQLTHWLEDNTWTLDNVSFKNSLHGYCVETNLFYSFKDFQTFWDIV